MTQIPWPSGVDAFEVVCRPGTYTGTDGVHPGTQGHLWLAADLAPRLATYITGGA